MPHMDYAGPSVNAVNENSNDWARIRAVANRVGWLVSLELHYLGERALRYQGRFGDTKHIFFGDEWLDLRARQLEARKLSDEAYAMFKEHLGA